MLKRFIWTVILLSCCKIATSQVLIALLFGDKLNSGKLEFGLVVVPQLSDITDMHGDMKPGLGLGLYFTIKINDRFSFHPEAIPKGAFGVQHLTPYPVGNESIDTLFQSGSIQRNIKAMSLPLLVRYRIAGLWYVEAGPQVDLLLSGKDVFKVKVDGNDLKYTTDIGGQFTRFDVAFAGGVVYKLRKDFGMSLGLRYVRGLTDIWKPTPGSQVNSVLQFNISIPIGTGKAAKAKATQQQQ